MIWCYSHSHHPVECEVQQGEIHEEKVPTELCNRPIESNHCIHYDTIYKCLNEKVREFDDNLQKRKGFCENIMMSSYTRVSIYLCETTCPKAYGKAEYIPAALSL